MSLRAICDDCGGEMDAHDCEREQRARVCSYCGQSGVPGSKWNSEVSAIEIFPGVWTQVHEGCAMDEAWTRFKEAE